MVTPVIFCPSKLTRGLDEAVAEAYGWPANLSDDEVLARLFQLTQGRAREKE